MNNLFQLILREPYRNLQPVVQHFHEVRIGKFTGKAEVKGANGLLARMLRKLAGFPAPAAETALTVKVIRSEVQERWLRNFGGTQFSSTLTRINRENVLSEDFGMLRFHYSLSVREGGIHWQLVGWNFAGIPMPDSFGPDVLVRESVNADGNYQFHVLVEFPLIGVLMEYSGWLDCQ
jgi:hypothetical protein